MLGFYNYTVILTYLSLASAVTGIVLTIERHPFWGVVCLMISGLCDAFDGKVARTRANSTAEERRFGIQIDSLCDLVAFGVLPCIIGYSIGMHHPLYIVVFVVYVMAALIRLAYFNVTEEVRQQQTTQQRKSYTGLPVTSAALLIPFVYGVLHLVPPFLFPIIFAASLLTIALLFVTRFRLCKPGIRGILLLIGVGVLEFLMIILLVHLFRHGGPR